MPSGIYIFTNKLNNKKYVGQSVNVKSRIIQHKSSAFRETDSQYNSIFYRAIRKYGLDNFIIETISCSTDELNNYEIDMIYQLNTLHPSGYNMTAGGDGGGVPIKLSLDDIDEIFNLLKNSSIELKDIAIQFNVHYNTISAINNGRSWVRNNISYPIRVREVNKNLCSRCGIEISKRSEMCIPCSQIEQRIVERPSKHELAKDVYNYGFTGTGRKYNVSANAVKKWCIKYEIGHYVKDIKQWYLDNL